MYYTEMRLEKYNYNKLYITMAFQEAMIRKGEPAVLRLYGILLKESVVEPPVLLC